MTRPVPGKVGVVVLAYGEEEHLDACLRSVQRSRGVTVDLVVVDNGCTRADVDALVASVGGRLLRPTSNLGFAGGCNLGVQALDPEAQVVLVNSDVVVDDDALRLLVQELRGDVGVATACVRLADEPQQVNSAGNPVHYTGITWAGGLGEPAAAHARRREVASASGATMAVPRRVWDELGGFDDTYFTYLEDTELSLRCWLSGRRVVYVPEAVSWHHYAFSRNPLKHYYLERNRLLMLLTVYERRTLLLLLPVLALWELAILVGAVLQGWGPTKIRTWWWLLTHTHHIRNRRRLVQAARTIGDERLARLLESRISGPEVPAPAVFALLDGMLALGWRLVRRRLTSA